MAQEGYYRHSGKYEVTGFLLGFVTAVAAAVGLAFVYAYAVRYIPIIYVNLVLVLGFGAASGAITAIFMKKQRVRSTAAVVGAALLAQAVGYYASWAVWMNIVAHQASAKSEASPATFAFDPAFLWYAVNRVNEVGAWSLKGGTTVSGIALWVVWGVELAAIFATAFVVARKIITTEPFCDACEEWCAAKQGVAWCGAGDRAELVLRAEAKDFGHVEKLGPARPGATPTYRFDLNTCPKCGELNALSVHLCTLKVVKGEVKTDTKCVVDKLLLTAAEADALRKFGERLTAAALVPEPAKPAAPA